MTGAEAWVISLAERPDRLGVFRQRAAHARMVVSELVVSRCTVRGDGWGGSPESYGNAQAHLRVLRTAEPGPLAVFEDDAVLPVGLRFYIGGAVDQLPGDWEVCVLGGAELRTEPYDPTRRSRVACQHFAYTHAYLVSERGRGPLADCAATANRHWDGLASRRMCGRGHVYAYMPTLVPQDPMLGSDIPDSRRAAKR